MLSMQTDKTYLCSFVTDFLSLLGAFWPGGGTQHFLVDVYHAGFKMYGLGSRLSLKNGGLGNENLEKFESRELEFWPKRG